MDAAPSAPPAATASSPERSPFLTAWPRSAQLTTAFLLGVTVALVAIHTLGYFRWGTRPVALEHRVDLNRANREELLQLPGVGDHMAQRILDHRRHEPFASVDDLRRVPGVGPATLERLRPWLCVTDEGLETEALPEPAPLVLRRTKGLEPGPARAGKKALTLDKPINLNEAGIDGLSLLPNIGSKRAAAIVAERQKGRFQSVDDLHRVPGIGKATIDKLRPLVTVEFDTQHLAVGNAGNPPTEPITPLSPAPYPWPPSFAWRVDGSEV